MPIKKYCNIRPKAAFPGLDDWLGNMPDCALFDGCAGSSASVLIANLYDSISDRSIFVLTENKKRADVFAEECATLLGKEHISVFPSRDAIPYNQKSPFGPTVEARFRALSDMMNNKRRVYIAPSVTLLQKVLPPKKLFNSVIRLNVGDEVSQESLATWLTENGFVRETMADNLGTFAIRGDIFDIYPFIAEHPVRIEFFGDTIESIRLFDVFTQKSRAKNESIEIFPMSEFCFTGDQVAGALDKMHNYCEGNNCDSAAFRSIEHHWKSLDDHEGIEWFLHWFDMSYATVLDYIPDSTVLVWHDMLGISRRLEQHIENYERHMKRLPESLIPLVSPPSRLCKPIDTIERAVASSRRIFINTETDAIAPDYSKRLLMQEQPAFAQSLDPLIADLQSRDAHGYDISILCESIGHAERLQELISEQCPFVGIAVAFLERGFVDKESKCILYAENQIFNRAHYRKPSRKIRSGTPIAGFDALAPGDFVVHVDHGIGRFAGIERIKTDAIQRDCMAVEYQDAARLYVPVEDFHKVQKYIGKDSGAPVLSKLGTAAWEKLKRRTRTALKEMAEELIALYAKRHYLEGIKFSSDSVWQKEFEDAFIFDETPDQHKAIHDVKADMESAKPMDRLICGDVGFGKTEVALRAAFKAASDGYQAAILAPTTILVAQHYNTFCERMASFPVSVAMLSRFLSAKEQRPVVEKLKQGTIDIVIGTHRLLSKDIAFKNLGLLVVDEEQRFGVRHKEKLKQYRYKVDVLSMTATPIPRTLHLSLIGARDLSIINTPPANRLPIETHVLQYHDQILKDAIENELDRGGQVYVVHNRIASLYSLQDTIEQLVPRARIAVAHGQMNEKELELIMRGFIAGNFDVLISTVIIENGLDIPNVNTLIVNRADAMGLSQLYQLRGRVGRSSEQAYAYLLTPPFKEVHELSLKRLRALEQYTELGSGFQIAMRDLEIRGAGNILGTRQHGFIAAVGFELYCTLLKEAVDEIKGESSEKKRMEVKVDIALEAFIPPDYISDSSARVAAYQELSSSESIEATSEIEAAFIDRFGPLPPPVSSLLLLIRIKIAASRLGISKAGINEQNVFSCAFEGDEGRIAEKIKHIIAASELHFQVVYGAPIVIKAALGASTILQRATQAYELLRSASEACGGTHGKAA